MALFYRRLSLFIVLLLISGCPTTSTPGPGNNNGGTPPNTNNPDPGTGPDTEPEPEPITLNISPAFASLFVGGKASLTAVSNDPLDNIAWTSSAPGVATVNNVGLIDARAAGNATISAAGSNSGIVALGSIVVKEPPPARIIVTPTAITLRASEILQLVASSTDAEDTFNWSSSDEAHVSVTPGGIVAGIAEGTAIISAVGKHSGDLGTAHVTVTGEPLKRVSISPREFTLQINDSITLNATSSDPTDTFSWSSSNNSSATVTQDGLVTALADGQTSISVRGSSTGETDTALVTVSPPPPVLVNVLPTEITLERSQTTALTATSTDDLDAFTWSSANEGVATVSPEGFVTATAAGTALISARGTHSQKIGTTSIAVLEGSPAKVTVSPRELSLQVGESLALSATSTDPEDAFLWTTSDDTAAAINEDGRITAVAKGNATITVNGTHSGNSDTATVLISAAVVTELGVTPATATLEESQTLRLTASSTDVADTFVWISSDAAIATVSTAGLVTGVKAGSAIISVRGTSSQKLATTTVRVTASEPAKVSASPRVFTLRINETVSMAATSTDPLDTFTWTSSSTATATVSPNGRVTAVAEGNAIITVRGTHSSSSGTAAVMVLPPPPAEVTVSPATATVEVAKSLRFFAVSTDAEDVFSWSSSNTSFATVSETGLVKGVEEGVATITARGSHSQKLDTGVVTITGRAPAVVSVKPQAFTLRVREILSLAGTSSDPEDTLSWSSTNPDSAAVDQEGLVTAIDVGEATIEARSVLTGTSGTSFVTISPEPPALITINPNESTLRETQTVMLSATSTDAEDTFDWSSSDPDIATVSAEGLVTAISEGEVTLTARGSHSEDTGMATVLVSGPPPADIRVSPTTRTLRATENVELTAESTDEEDNFTWSSANPEIATVTSSGGMVTAIAGGTAMIVARGSHSGDTGHAAITVEGNAPAFITVLPATTILRPTLSATLQASSTDELDVFSWSSSDEAVATVGPNGNVTAVSVGSAIISTRGAHSGDSGTAAVTVAGTAPAQITLSQEETALRVGETALLTAMSSEAGDTAFTWTSADESIATVSPNGMVTAMNVGEVDITARGSSSNDTGLGRVTVGSARIAIQSDGLPIAIGTTEALRAVSTDPGDQFFTWNSTTPDVVAVSEAGIILGLAEGTATIRAVGNKSGSAGLVNITVIPSITALLLWDGESGFSGSNGSLNTPEAFRGNGCFEAAPTKFRPTALDFLGYPGHRADISIYDEIWLFAKIDTLGRTTAFQVRSFAGNSKVVNIDSYVDGGSLGLEYRLVRIPIADLQKENFQLNIVENLFFGLADPVEGHKFYIDDVWAVSLGATDGVNAPLVGSIQGVDFGDVALGGSVAREVTVSNIGPDPLNISSLSITGSHADEFTVTNGAFSLATNESRTFSISFVPKRVLNKSVGEKRAGVLMSHNLTAMGIATTVPLSGRALAPAIALSRTSLNMGNVPVGQSLTKSFDVVNPGNVPLNVALITSTNSAYTMTPNTFNLAGGANQEITVSFAPTVVGSAADVISVNSNATDMELQTLALSGMGLAEDLIGDLALETKGKTSSTVTLEWPVIGNADSINIYLGPEPSATFNAPLSPQKLMATINGNMTEHTVGNLAPDVDMFFHVEILDASAEVIAQGNHHTRTLGGPGADLDGAVREVHLVAPNILQVVVANLQVHSFTDEGNVNDGGIEEVVGDIGPELQAATWSIVRENGDPIEILNIHRQSIPVGAPYYEVGPMAESVHLNLLDVDHRLFFVLAEPIGNLEFLTVTGPEITRGLVSFDHEISEVDLQPTFLLPFSDKYLETPAIQLNQMGYSPAATERYAYVSTYMGDGGAMNFQGYPANAQIYLDPADRLAIRTPVGSPITMETRAELDEDSGTGVLQVDLSAVPAAEKVVYRVHIPGVGVSWPTQVSETAMYRAFYTATRFLTHTRWGRVLSPDWTEWSPRPADHPTVYTSDVPFEDRFIPVGVPQTGERLLAGGHHDAADFDINYTHTLHAMNLMRLYELRPEIFTDGQLNIPESGNGIPDLVDEIIYNLAVWEQLQEADGGVRPGFESTGHPTSINFADLDQLPYWTFARNANHSVRVAALFAQAATLFADIAPLKAEGYRQRAFAAYDYALANGVSAVTKGPTMYAAGELYRLTGEPSYRNLYETIWIDDTLPGFGPSIFPFRPWNASWFLDAQPILLDHIFGYLLTDDPTPLFVEEVLHRLDGYAEDAFEDVHTFHAHRNGRKPPLSPNWGRGSTSGEYVKRLYARMQLGGIPPEDLQRYYNTISLSADYVLGCNPLGMVWLSGMGSRRPMEPQHADSQTFVAKGFDPIPGIAIYGPRSGLPNTSTYDFGRKLFYPDVEDLPRLRKYADVNSWPATNEFTIQETQVPQIVLFGMLVAEGMMPPDTWLPFGPEHRTTLAPREDATPAGRGE